MVNSRFNHPIEPMKLGNKRDDQQNHGEGTHEHRADCDNHDHCDEDRRSDPLLPDIPFAPESL